MCGEILPKRETAEVTPVPDPVELQAIIEKICVHFEKKKTAKSMSPRLQLQEITMDSL